LLLAAVLVVAPQQGQAQMTGDITGDMTIIGSALAATIAATGNTDAEDSRLTMEELYRQWRIFRAKDFETQAADPLFIPNMEKVEAALFAASKLIDNKQLTEARDELQNAQKLLQAIKPIATPPGEDPPRT